MFDRIKWWLYKWNKNSRVGVIDKWMFFSFTKFYYCLCIVFIFGHAKNIDLPLKTTNICKRKEDNLSFTLLKSIRFYSSLEDWIELINSKSNNEHLLLHFYFN